MRRHAFLGPALWAACSHATPRFNIRLNSSSSSLLSVAVPDGSNTAIPHSSTTTQTSTTLPELSPSASLPSFDNSTSSWSTIQSTPSSSPQSSLSTSTSTFLSIPSTPTPEPDDCTGCVLEVLTPTTISYDSHKTIWTDIKITETVLSRTVTYMDGTTIDTVVTELETLTQDKNREFSKGSQMITHTTPVFTWVPIEGTTITLDVGPTYVAYTDIHGGLNSWSSAAEPFETGTILTEFIEPLCTVDVFPLHQLKPSKTQDYQYFIQTYVDSAPTHLPGLPISLPPALISHLKSAHGISSIFRGSDIATCTLQPPAIILPTDPPEAPEFTFPPGRTTGPITSTYLSKTYEATSTHVTRQGCLRCSKPEGPEVTPERTAQPSEKPENIQPPISEKSPQPPNETPKSTPPQLEPQSQVRPDIPQTPDAITVTIGDRLVPVRPVQPTQPSRPTGPGQQPQQQNPGVVIGSETLTSGQTTTINGVQVIVPSAGAGSNIVVGGSTVKITNPAPTGPPVLTVGESTVTANPQGGFVVGTQTLVPGGSQITVNGDTLSLGPSGTIAVVNGVTQTLRNAPNPTQPPVLSVGNQAVFATVIGGTTQYILGPGQTLAPGGILTVDGTTFSLPEDGSGATVVVNGVTSILNAPGFPVMTFSGQVITASVVGGTTAFVLGPGQTLTAGGVIVVSGTTYSMPSSASGSVVVINGVTSTLGQPPVTSAGALTINGKTYSATIREGTTEYNLGGGTTLKPGEAVTISGTTYSLDPKGTALIINGKTSSISNAPASNSASTTRSATNSEATADSSGTRTTDKSGNGVSLRGGMDKWVEGVIIGIAGWLVMF